MAKRKFKKKSTAGGGAKKKTAPGKRAGKKPTTRATKKPPPKKKLRGHGAAEVPGRAASRIAVASASSRVRARGGSITSTHPPTVHPIDELPLADIDFMRLVNNLDCRPGSAFPGQHQRGEPSPVSTSLVEDTFKRERRLDEAAPYLGTGSEAELLQLALWVAGGVRLPRAAIVGRALQELDSTSEHLAKAKGTADRICSRIRRQNPAHLRNAIIKAMDSGLDAEVISGKLVGHLRSAWAILEKLRLLKAAYGAGVYLVGLGPKVFDGFPDWATPDEPMPKKPTRPKKRPLS